MNIPEAHSRLILHTLNAYIGFMTAVDEPQVGGVYVRLFLKDPKFPLRNRKRFLEGLLDQYVATSATVRSGSGDPELPLLFSAALVSLLRVHVSS